MKLYASLGEAVADKDLLDLVPMISLEDNRIVLGSTAAGAICLQFRGKLWEVDAFTVNAFDNGGWFAPFAHFHSDLYRLLLHANGAANAQVFRQAAGRTNIGHSRGLRLLCGRPRAK